MSKLKNWSDESPNDRRRKKDWSDWADEFLGLVWSANIGEPLEQKIPNSNFQESRHKNGDKLS